MFCARPVAISLAVLALATPAFAQQDVLKLCERLNKKAMEDYDSLEFDSARQTLLSAIAKLRDAGQDETPTAARIYVNLGTVYIAGFKDKNRGVQQFVNALKIDPNAHLDQERATPELQEAFDQAVKQAGGKKGGGRKPPREEPPPDEPPAAQVKGLQHTPVDEGKAGIDVQIKAQLGADVPPSRLFLFYRSGGQEDYVSVPMQKQGGDWVGTIPGDAMEGKAVQYYLEARDSRGRPVMGGNASAASPYIITVNEGTGGSSNVDVDVEDPLAKQRKKKHGQGDEEEGPKEGRGFGRMFFNLMGGVGVGFAPAGNTTEVAYRFDVNTGKYIPLPVDAPGGLVYEPLHISVELGINITNRIAISGIFRLGMTLINNADTAPDPPGCEGADCTYSPPLGAGTSRAKNDIAGMLRFRYQFGDGKAHPFVHFGLGGGTIRHVLDIAAAETPDRPLADFTTADYYKNTTPKANDPINEICADHSKCVDTLAIGYILAAVGGGIYIDFATFKNGGFGVIVDGDLIFGLPVGGQFGLNLDIQVGIGSHFL
jgi:hypothetical protein